VWTTALVVAGGGLLVMNAERLGITRSSPSSATQQAAEPNKESPAPSDAGDVADPTEDPGPNVAPSDVEGQDASGSAEAEEGQPEQPSAADLDNPFLIPDSNSPSCDSILGGKAPDPGADPLVTSSEAWAEARGAIVSADLKLANLKMCQAVALNPQSAAVEGLAHLYLRLRSHSEALKWADKAEQLRPGQLDIGNLKGDAFAFQGDAEKARAAWLLALNIESPEDPRIGAVSKDYSVEAGRDLRRGDYPRAELFYRRAVILDMQNLTGLIGLAKVYQKLEKPNYARAFAEMSLKVTDVMPEVHVLLGELALSVGNKDEAKARFERALAVRPDYFPAKRELAEMQQ
jgi:Tfp pilus assembly protein PilF